MPGHDEMPEPVPRTPTVIMIVRSPITAADVPQLCERVNSLLLHSGAGLLVCDVSLLTEPDAATLQALARMALTARRLGRRMRLRQPCGRLQDLLALAGLCDVLPGFESRRQVEQREQGRRVQERAEPDDPAG